MNFRDLIKSLEDQLSAARQGFSNDGSLEQKLLTTAANSAGGKRKAAQDAKDAKIPSAEKRGELAAAMGARADQLALGNRAREKARVDKARESTADAPEFDGVGGEGATGGFDGSDFTAVARQLAADPRLSPGIQVAKANQGLFGNLGDTMFNRERQILLAGDALKRANAKDDLEQELLKQKAKQGDASFWEGKQDRTDARNLAQSNRIQAGQDKQKADLEAKIYRAPKQSKRWERSDDTRTIDPFNVGQATADKYLSLLKSFLR